MRKLTMLVMSIAVMLSTTSAIAGQSNITGNISNSTFIRGGTLFMLDSGLPDNCYGSPWGWIKVKDEDKSLSRVIAALWLTDKRQVTVYTDGRENGTGFCIVNQIDPK